jgi:hypothetical protein
MNIMLLNVHVSRKSAQQRRIFADRCKWKYICGWTVERYDFRKSKERLGKMYILSQNIMLIVLLFIYLFICCWMATSVAELMQCWMVAWLMTWKECGRKLSCPDLRYYPALACCFVSSRFKKRLPVVSTVQQVYPAIEWYHALFLHSVYKYIKQQIWIHVREIISPLNFLFRTV